jgi:C-terminal processing protease CtpA/Prc
VEIRGNSLLKVTTAHWLTPNGSLIDKIGLTPDIEVKMTEEDYKKGRDPQLEKAIEILKQFKVK